MSRARDFADLAGSANAGGITGRNLIINGAMQVWQRSTSVSSLTGSGYKTADRWRTNPSGGTYNQSRQTVPLGDSVVGDFKYFLRHEVTTGNNLTGIQQRIEDVQSVPEGTVTVSFYAKGTNPNAGSITIGTKQVFGTGGSPSSDVEVAGAATLTLTSSWQRFNFQLTVASISGKTLGTNNDSYFQIQFTQADGDTSTDAWTLDITGIQLELGSTATPFEHRSFGDELARCRRYFEKSYDVGTTPATSDYSGTENWSVNSEGNGNTIIRPSFNVEKRAAPTMVAYQATGASGSWNYERSGAAGTNTTTFDRKGTNGCRAYVPIGANFASAYIFGHWTADAEL